MIIFHNPGLIPLDAIRLMGASVKLEGAFGRFGTGFKYAVATILRGGGTVRVWRGAEELDFFARDVDIRGTTFQEVWLDRVLDKAVDLHEATPLGFTTQLGKDWEPWMALRELACNARDEGGDFKVIEVEAVPPCFSAKDGETVICVDWAEMDEAACSDGDKGGAHVFVSGELLHEERGVRVHAGVSEYLYHRGVRVWKLPKPSTFTYDIVSAVDLTEDRGVKYGFCVEADVRNLFLLTDERPIIAAAVTAGEGRWEGTFDWSGSTWGKVDPGQTWLEEVAVLRDGVGHGLSKSARDVFLSVSAFKTEEQCSCYEEPTGTFGDAVEELGRLGIEVDKVNVFLTEELPGEAHSAVSKGSIYVTAAFTQLDRLSIAVELLVRYLELKSRGNFEALLKLVVPLLIDQSYDLKSEREVAEARAAGLRPTMLEAWLGLHPVIDHTPEVPADAPDF
jgi:hypothetical protein